MEWGRSTRDSVSWMRCPPPRPGRPVLSLWIAALCVATGCAAGGVVGCAGPREPQGRGWASPVLPAQASLRPATGGEGGALALLIETERGVLLRVVGARLAPGRHELVLAPDEARALPLERLDVMRVGADGRGDLELELEGETLTAASNLLGRELALVGPGGTLLRGVIDKGVEVDQTAPGARPAGPPPRSRPAAGPLPQPDPPLVQARP